MYIYVYMYMYMYIYILHAHTSVRIYVTIRSLFMDQLLSQYLPEYPDNAFAKY